MERLKILVVDDESRMRKLVRDFLVKKDFEVLEAGDGEEALDVFYNEKNIALVILDVMMPKINGWDVCREIRENSKVPIIMLTAKGAENCLLYTSLPPYPNPQTDNCRILLVPFTWILKSSPISLTVMTESG